MTAGRAIPGTQKRLLGLLLMLLIAAQIDQPYPEVALLQHIPTLLLFVASPWLLRRWPLSTASLACITAFLALHTLGGGMAPRSGLDMPYYSFGKSVYRLRRE